MSDFLKKNSISIKERQKIITAVPCFRMLNFNESLALAELMGEVKYNTDDIIVRENDLVDSVYIIVKGKAEVSQAIPRKLKKLKKLRKPTIDIVPIAILTAGDTIGLNDTGFFSPSGKRVATVKAISPVLLLYLDIKKLHQFLKQYQHVQHSMFFNAETLLRIALIKQSLPFSKLSHERLYWLSEHVEVLKVPAGEIIFRQGDEGDSCYLVISGEIAISMQDEEGKETLIAILKTPTLFGEATLITESLRNATASAIVDSELFVLKYQYLSELIESEKNVANMFMTLMIDRSRPLKNPHVSAHVRTTADKQKVIILKNPDNGHYFKLSKEGWYIFKQMNGKQTMRAITLSLANKYHVFAPDVVAALISKLAKTNFIINVKTDENLKINTYPKWLKWMFQIKTLLEKRIVFGDADKWLNSIYQHWAYLFFKPAIKIFLSVCIVLGFILFVFVSDHMTQFVKFTPNFWLLMVLMLPFTLLSVALHELGHALATKSYGHEVHYMGVGWYWLGPVAFTDTSDMWLSTRWPRVFVNMAGIYTDLIVGFILSVIIWLLPEGDFKIFLWLFALFTYLSAFRMLNPLQELDGYYALMDLFEKPKLRQSAIDWMLKDSLLSYKKHLPEFFYWLACLSFLVMSAVLTLFVQTLVFKILGFQPTHFWINLIIPSLMIVIFSLGIIIDIFSRKEE